MVDLVKARRKAKEKKAADESARSTEPDSVDQKSSGAVSGSKTKLPAEKKAAATVSAPSSGTEARELERATAEPERVVEPGEGFTSRRLEQIKQSLGVKRLFATGDALQRAVAAEELMELLLFSISGEMYAVPIEQIVEIIKPRTATRVPNSDDTIVGIISLRGTIVTILDVRRRLGHSGLAAVSEETRIVVVQHGEETAGFVVDRVWRVVRIEPSSVGSSPSVTSAEQNEFIRGVFQHGKNLAILLDLEKLLRS